MIRAITIGIFVLGVSLFLAGIIGFFRGVSSGESSGGWGSATLRLPTPVFMMLLGVLCLGGDAYLVMKSEADRPGASSYDSSKGPSSSTAAAPVTVGSIVKITSPENGHPISGKAGVVVSGTAVNLAPDETIWLLDYDPYDKQHAYYQVNEQPIPVVDERWSFKDAPIGAESDEIGTKYYVVAVKATPRCADFLQSQVPNEDGDITYSRLPDGCYKTSPVVLTKARD
jgi:hypothetical protein